MTLCRQRIDRCPPRGRLAHRAVVLVACLALAAAPGRAQRADSARAGVRPVAGDSTSRAAVPTPPAPRAKRVNVRDSLAPPVSAGRAFLSSFFLPGLGQARLNRPTAGGVYFAFEAISLVMLRKSAFELALAKRHRADVAVDSYQVDPVTGAPVLASGKYVVKDTVRSRYADPVEQSQVTAQQQRSRVKARRLHFEDWIAMLAFNHLFSGADAFVSSQLWDLPAQVEFRALPAGAGIGVRIPLR